MSTPLVPKPAKLVIGIFLKDKKLVAGVAEKLQEKFGDIDTVSGWIPFDFTSYYEEEMGSPLFRRLFSFKKLIRQEDLAGIKVMTNAIEQSYGRGGRRPVNIDPGYMLAARFVLATGKDFTHRIYIGQGIYADLTLMYQRGGFQVFPWTYPDYASPVMFGLLGQVRAKYMIDLKNSGFREEPIT